MSPVSGKTWIPLPCKTPVPRSDTSHQPVATGRPNITTSKFAHNFQRSDVNISTRPVTAEVPHTASDSSTGSGSWSSTKTSDHGDCVSSGSSQRVRVCTTLNTGGRPTSNALKGSLVIRPNTPPQRVGTPQNIGSSPSTTPPKGLHSIRPSSPLQNISSRTPTLTPDELLVILATGT